MTWWTLETTTTCRSLLYTTPTGTPLRTVSNANTFDPSANHSSPSLHNASLRVLLCMSHSYKLAEGGRDRHCACIYIHSSISHYICSRLVRCHIPPVGRRLWRGDWGQVCVCVHVCLPACARIYWHKQLWLWYNSRKSTALHYFPICMCSTYYDSFIC